MTISSVANSAAAASQSATSSAAKKTLTQDDFLKLFTTQMQFQNPLEPLDNYQMATQMSQFSSVESLNNINQGISNLLSSQTSWNNLQAQGLIGKKIEARGSGISVDQGVASMGSYQLSKPGNAIVQIYDAQGKCVRTIPVGSKDASRQKLEWDGKTQDGAALPDGSYTFRVTAVDEKGQAIPVTTYRSGPVSGVSFENGSVYFNVGSEKINFSDLTAILS
jgi:flagellar basal-body rod modification protein FlgD